jgi:hypothetical protein
MDNFKIAKYILKGMAYDQGIGIAITLNPLRWLFIPHYEMLKHDAYNDMVGMLTIKIHSYSFLLLSINFSEVYPQIFQEMEGDHIQELPEVSGPEYYEPPFATKILESIEELKRDIKKLE